VGEGDLSGSEGNVQEWHVQKDGDEGGFEEESEVSELVDHSLLRERQVSSFADHQVGPLHAHDGDEVSSLGEFKSFGTVANLRFRYVGDFVEVGSIIILWVPSAFGISFGGSVFFVEQSNI